MSIAELDSARVETKLWTPDIHGAEYYIPSAIELQSIWEAHTGKSDFLSLDQKNYGVCTIPTDMPKGYASIDLCEVVRNTGLALLRMRGGTMDDMALEPEHGGPDYGAALHEWTDEYKQLYRHHYIDELMRLQAIDPVPYSETIATFLRKWRQQGIYVAAITSTLEGGEESTIEFLARTYPGCFDGILFPRNHNGKGTLTKLQALNGARTAIAEHFSVEDSPSAPTIAIDDAVHHALGFDEAGIQALMPAYIWNESVETVGGKVLRIAQTFGTVDTFIAADTYLQGRLES